MSKKTPPTNRIAELRKARNMTQQQLADAVGSHWITISKLERGVMRLSDEWRGLIAKALGVDQWELVIGIRPLPTIHVEGWIEEGGTVQGFDEADTSESFRLSTKFFTNPDYRWLVVAGDALWPWFQDGDRVCVWNRDPDAVDDLIGRLCVVWYRDGDDNDSVCIGALERGSKARRYTVNRSGAAPLRDLDITAIAVVAMSVYYLGPGSFDEPEELLGPLDTDAVT